MHAHTHTLLGVYIDCDITAEECDTLSPISHFPYHQVCVLLPVQLACLNPKPQTNPNMNRFQYRIPLAKICLVHWVTLHNL